MDWPLYHPCPGDGIRRFIPAPGGAILRFMSIRLRALITGLLFALSLLAQVGAAAACTGAEVMDAAGGHADHAAHAGMAAEKTAAMPMDGDCCNDSEHCPMQACFTGAALPCAVTSLRLPPTAAQLPPIPARAIEPVCSRLERPPIFA
ncbi:hypothetical protein [Parahaliea mediterranea]|uniref:CopL family metal-binding regulatory protein n=1 Tax=Parahaliea mediterranea TaxID=651086 RepID=A0A939ILY5_9GAMM|nr:hypothetical protein [Parahaliea mediterranea]MBN7796473.1 hypothetical protein [Parahaliea mediterranea]